MSVTSATKKSRRRQLGEIRGMVASWEHGHLPYAGRLAVYPYRDVRVWCELQQGVAEAGFISVPMLACWLDKEMQTFTTPARRRIFAFTGRERNERGDSDCRSHHE